MAWQEPLYYLRAAVRVSQQAGDHGNTPFGAILVNADGEIGLELFILQRIILHETRTGGCNGSRGHDGTLENGRSLTPPALSFFRFFRLRCFFIAGPDDFQR